MLNPQYYTHLNPIFNANPEEGNNKRANGWKTLNAFKYQAKKLATCLIRNERLQGKRYTWHVAVNIQEVYSDDEHKRVWKQAAKVGQHISAFWIREPDTSNHVNYHLILNTEISEGRLRACVKDAFQAIPFTYGIERVYSTFGLCRYITKADDRYSDKRLLFAKYCTLNKHGVIGKFWHKSIKQIWDDVIDEERLISATISEHYDITRAAKYLHRLTDGYIPFRRIRRNLALQYPAIETVVAGLAAQWETEYPVF